MTLSVMLDVDTSRSVTIRDRAEVPVWTNLSLTRDVRPGVSTVGGEFVDNYTSVI